MERNCTILTEIDWFSAFMAGPHSLLTSLKPFRY